MRSRAKAKTRSRKSQSQRRVPLCHPSAPTCNCLRLSPISTNTSTTRRPPPCARRIPTRPRHHPPPSSRRHKPPRVRQQLAPSRDMPQRRATPRHHRRPPTAPCSLQDSRPLRAKHNPRLPHHIKPPRPRHPPNVSASWAAPCRPATTTRRRLRDRHPLARQALPSHATQTTLGSRSRLRRVPRWAA